MAQYILRRLVLLIPTLVLVTLLVFSIIRLLPGNIVVLMLSEQGYASDRAIGAHAGARSSLL
jgi:peptide/nickel transport system permease protein